MSTPLISIRDGRLLSLAPNESARQTKICADCGEAKPLENFSVKDRHRGYLNKYCKPCDSRRSILRQSGRTAERVAYNRRWRAENPNKVREYNRRGGARYRDRHPNYFQQYYLANREKRIENTRHWRETNRERYLSAETERRLRKKLGLRPDDLLALIESAVSKALPPVLREDACQELAVRLLTGEATASNVQTEAKEIVKGLYAAHDMRFKTVSLDAPMSGENDMTFADSLVG